MVPRFSKPKLLALSPLTVPKLLMVPLLMMPTPAMGLPTTVTPAPTSRIVPDGMVSPAPWKQLSLPPFQTPPREFGQTVEPFEVVIVITVAAWAGSATRGRAAMADTAKMRTADAGQSRRGFRA